ncbi:formyltetrahydrofolate-dependent phosphoribosylglycinamide formyltransferase [Anaerobacterium chartisolvens]|uniref:Phosphoribosylglycinamide formyltransferase n=1 Tax=Anaerobacterium chartisolvens TaxID=1297424 RepID=A0A369B5Y4_9FIRM|nr:phosphoribosylglycinamide formyltransferase [Anaerobacterium chartisolvens]RCX16929.1 formyltetrahydrofolate-dependent phosphoribosylglycinamide formyltransferase [Anaerobacterium chartisolvens]
MLRIGVLVSGGGTNLQAIIDKIENGYLDKCSIVTVVSGKHDAYALQRATKHGIPSICISSKDYASIDEYDTAIIEHFKEYQVGLVVMAGFLSILGEKFTMAFQNKIINIHPSLIPAFCGKGYYGIIPHRRALEYGVRVSGATVHFVEREADAGPIILQKAVSIEQEDTPETLQKRIMEEAEWDILPAAIKLFSENRLVVEGRRVRILP